MRIRGKKNPRRRSAQFGTVFAGYRFGKRKTKTSNTDRGKKSEKRRK